MSLLPGQILPQSVPLATISADGKTVTIDKNWWLFLYNIAQNSLSTGVGTPGITDSEQILFNEIDARVTDTTGGGGGGSGTVTDFSFTNANGFTGVVTNDTTTPNLTLDSDFMENPMTTEGDIIIENATPAPDRLAYVADGKFLGAVSGLPAWVDNPEVSGQIVYETAGSYTWTKPDGISVVKILCIGPGGNGFSPVSYSAVGPGGGSGGNMYIEMIADLVPSTLYITIGAGGGGTTSSNYSVVSAFNNGYIVNDMFAYAGGGGNATSSAGGAAGITPAAANLFFYGASTLSGVTYLIGIGQAGGVASSSVTHYPIVTAGAGSTTSAVTGNGILARGSQAAILGGSYGSIGVPGGNGVDGTSTSIAGMFQYNGGTAGGGGYNSFGNYTNGGNGGKGGPGCGGGGGGPAFGSPASPGSGGPGGDGLVVIAWA